MTQTTLRWRCDSPMYN